MKIKAAPRHKDKIYFPISAKIANREREFLIVIALWELCHMADFCAVPADKADMNRIHGNRGVAADNDFIRPLFAKIHVLKFDSHIISNVSDRLFANRERVAGNRIIFRGKKFSVCFFLSRAVKTLQG